MPCYHPITAYRSRYLNPSGKRGLVFKEEEALPFSELQIACGQCIGCRLERSRQWALRCIHEAQLHKDNCFVTLTYSPENLPSNGSLVKADYQKFMKRLRFFYPDRSIRYYMCGEYGDDNGRPHYHACLFNLDFDDKELMSIRDGVRLYTSEKLNQIWGLGYCVIGDVTFDSAAYVARYIMKKVTGESAVERYYSIDESTGELQEIIPEYNGMSLKPAIAHDWFERYKDDLRKDFITMRGKKLQPPKYYDKLFEVEEPAFIEEIKKARVKRAKESSDNTCERLQVREDIKKRKIKQLKRSL